MTVQHLILIIHSISMGWALYLTFRVPLYRPFAIALGLYNLAGLAYYVSILYLHIPGHELSIYRSMFQAAIWLAFGVAFAWRRS